MNFSNNDPNDNGLKEAMRDICADSESSDELFFDPATGELRSARSDDDSDRVPATQMAREGFFLLEDATVLARRPNSEPPTSGTPTPAETLAASPKADLTFEQHEELVFDSKSGELQATRTTEATDRVPATRMAREGFFADSTLTCDR